MILHLGNSARNSEVVALSNLNINSPKYESIFWAERESRRLTSAKEKNGSTPSIYVSDYKTAGEIIRVAYTFCSEAYVSSILRTDLCFAKNAKYFFL